MVARRIEYLYDTPLQIKLTRNFLIRIDIVQCRTVKWLGGISVSEMDGRRLKMTKDHVLKAKKEISRIK